MRKLIPAFFGVVGLAIACHGFGVGHGATAPEAKASANVPQLLKDLTHPDEKVSQAAVDALAKVGMDRPEEILKAFKDGDAKTRPVLATVLGEIRHAAIELRRFKFANSIEKALIESLRDVNHYVVVRASEALTNKEPRSEKSIPIFIEIIQDNKKTNVARAGALIGLRNLGPAASEAIPVLLDCFNKNVGKKLNSVKDLENTTEYLEGDRAVILRALVKISRDDHRVIAALRKALRNEKEEVYVRANAALMLSDMGERGQPIVPDLIKIIEDKAAKNKVDLDDILGCAAIEALTKLKIKSKHVAPILTIARNRSEPTNVRRNAVKALYNSPEASREAWLPLLAILDGSHSPENMDAAVALRIIEPPTNLSVPEIIRELRRIREQDKMDKGLSQQLDLTINKLENTKSK